MSLVDKARFAWKIARLLSAAQSSPENIASIQQKRLDELVRHAVATSRYYRDTIGTLSPDEPVRLQDLPTTNKTLLMDNFDDVITDPTLLRRDVEEFQADENNLGKYLRDRYVVSHTSGSTGRPMIIVQQPEDVELLFAIQAARGTHHINSLTDVLAQSFEDHRLAVVMLKPGFYPSAVAFEYMPASSKEMINFRRFAEHDQNLAERLAEFSPTHLTAYASILSRLADQVEAGTLRLPHLKQIVNNSEMLTPQARTRFQEVFGVPVLNNYAMGECPFVAVGCGDRPEMIVNADWAILEVVDADNNPVPAGQTGEKVLITNLSNRIQPIIRYEVKDRVTMSTDHSAHAPALPLIDRIDGRVSETIHIMAGGQDRDITPIIFNHAFEYCVEVREWRVIQEAPDQLRFQVEMLPGASFNEQCCRQSIDNQLKELSLVDSLHYTVEEVAELRPNESTNKFQRVVNNMQPAGAAN